MVLGGGASLQLFPGMEHERGFFKGLEGPSNGIASTNDRKEPGTIPKTPEQPPAAPITPTAGEPREEIMSPPSQTLPPLHINTSNESSSAAAAASAESRTSEVPSNGSGRKQQKYPTPRNIRDCPTKSTSSTASPLVVMGPPTNSNAPVLLSPAGNLHNGYSRLSSASGDSAPSSPSFVNRQTSSKNIPHPLATPRSAQPRQSAQSSAIPSPLTTTSSLGSPQNGRKEHEMTRRRALVERIGKSRGVDYVHMIPQVESLTHTQTSILLRKHRASLAQNEVPFSLQQLIDCTSEKDKTAENFKKKLRDVKHKRNRHTEFDDLTDVSDLEEDIEQCESLERGPKWTAKRMRYCGALSRVDTLLAEKTALMGMLRTQRNVMDASCGVRFVGEELTSRRRRRLNQMYYLYDKTPLRRISAEQFGCARAMPIHSWTKRKQTIDVFEDVPAKNGTSSFLSKSPVGNDKWVATGQNNMTVHLTNGEIREITETDYEEYRIGEGLQQINELSATDPMLFLPASDFTPFEERQMAYMYRLSTTASSAIRKKHGKAIFFETDDRKIVTEKSETVKNKSHHKKERRRVEDPSSDEESSKSGKKKSRGRPATTPAPVKKKPSRPSTSTNAASKLSPYMYIDYLFEEYMNEDICVKHLPSRITYAQFKTIHVPDWWQIDDTTYWADTPASSNAPPEESSSEDLLVTVAKHHHRLMHMERERVQGFKKDTGQRNRNRQSTIKSAATTPSHNPDIDDCTEDGKYPPFDLRQFQPSIVQHRRRFASIAKPYEPRDFLKNSKEEEDLPTTTPPTTSSAP